MMRVRFGTFEALLGTAVFANEWWLRVAAQVSLEGTHAWYDLEAMIPPAATMMAAPLPARVDADWFRAHAPIALGAAAADRLEPIELGMVAARVVDKIDIAFPFLVEERSGRVYCGFSDLGPEETIRDSIMIAVACRLTSVAAVAR